MREKGSFTVEAALIMPMILGVIVLFIYMGMFMFDRCTIKYICQKASCEGVCEGDDIELFAEGYAADELSRRLILGWDTDISAYSDDRYLTTTIEAKSTLFDRSFTHTARAVKHFLPKY